MKRLPRLRVILGALLAALVVLHVWNLIRVDSKGLSAGVEPLFERSRQIEERARPEYQDYALATLPANSKNGDFVRLDDRLADANVVEAPTLTSAGVESILFSLEMDDSGRSGLVAPNDDVTQSIRDGVLRLSGHGGVGFVSNVAPIDVERQQIGDIVIRARASKQTRMTLGWAQDANPDNPFKNQLDMTLEASEELQTYVIDASEVLRRGLGPEDAVGHIFLRPSSIADADLEIDFIRFVSKRALYLASANGVVYESVRGELRPAIYMLTDQSLHWTINVPESAPSLDFGTGLLDDSGPVRFSVAVIENDQSRVIHEISMDGSAEWQDASIDLSEWAGRSVTVELGADSSSPLTVALWSSPVVRSAPRDRYNVVVILEDTLRADYLSTYGYGRETSPNKTDAFSRQGVVFEYAFSQATKTRPSVPSIMTGLYPLATGVWHFSDVLSDRYLTLAEILRNQGYVTASFIQNGNAGASSGLHQGFDVLRDERMMSGPSDEVLGEPAFDWLEKHRDENFFLYLHAIDPHGPYDPEPPYDNWYEDEKGRGSAVEAGFRYEPEGMDTATDNERRARYAGEIRYNDALIPGFLDKLRELGLDRNTLVVLLSDHGEYMGEHGDWEHRPPGFTPVIRVPLMFLYPAAFPDARRITENVQLVDVVPTILDLGGIDRSGLLIQGESLVDLIEGRDPEYWQNRVVISEEPTAMLKEDPCTCASLIYRNWHLVASTWTWPGGPLVSWFPTPQAVAKLRVFDFHEDPQEEGLFWSFLPDLHLRWLHYRTVSRLQELNGSIHSRLTADDDASKRLDPATIEHLRGLGYVN